MPTQVSHFKTTPSHNKIRRGTGDKVSDFILAHMGQRPHNAHSGVVAVDEARRGTQKYTSSSRAFKRDLTAKGEAAATKQF